ncbi:MAG TPA: DMT family transporter [Chlamydiales bacterium]|nr:DMT family transporter [Chlamydiales bacterium]
MKTKSFAVGALYTLGSAAFLALTGLLGKLGIEQLSLTALIFWRYLSALFFCIVLLWVARKLHGWISHFQHIKMHLLRTFFVLVAQYSFYFYLQKNSLMNATLLINTGPLFIPFIEWGLMGTKIGRSTWISLLISFVGVVLVLQPDRDIFTLMSFIGLLSGLAQGASQVVFGLNSQTERSDLGVFYLFILTPLFTFPFYLIEGSTWIDTPASWNWTILLVAALGISSVCNQLLRAEAYEHSSPSRLSVFLYFSIVVAGFLDWIFFNYLPNFLSIIGAALVIIGGVLKIYLRHQILKKNPP